MATRPKAVIESRNGEKLSPITIAKNVLIDDGQNLHDILSDRKEDMMSPTIENSSSMFKVGQGDNVDYSSNVVNGAYESMVLKGKTMVNCIQEPSSEDVVLPYEFEEGQYVTINDTKESGALGVELKGQTLVNIHKSATYSLSRKNEGWYENLVAETNRISFEVTDTSTDGWKYLNLGKLNLDMLKPNTKYLVYFGVANFPHNLGVRFMNGNATDKISNEVMVAQGSNWAILTTSSEIIKSEQVLYVTFTNVLGKVEVGNAMIFEYQEGMENWDISFFTGMTSCKMPILKSVNQMFDYSLATKPSGSGTISFTNNGRSLKVNFDVTRDCVNVTNITLPAGTYEISYEIRGVVTLPDGASLSSSRAGLSMFKSSQNWYNAAESLHVNFANMNPTNYTKAKKTITFDESVTVAVVYHGWNNNPVGWCEIKDIRIVPQGKTSILSLPEEVVLRSLPNGVCDTFNTRTGVYTQRVYETIITGTENWVQYDASNTNRQETIAFSANLGLGDIFDNDKTYSRLGGVICDKLNHINSVWGIDKDIEGISADQRNVIIQIKKTRLASEDIAGFKTWLRSNNLKVGIQLKVPTITKINLPSTPKSWNTTTHIYSEIPENTLYPILSHSNPTYPVILKPSTKYSIVANSYSNDHTNSTINFNLGGATASTVVGNRVTTITTPSTLSNELLTMSGRGNKLNNVMVIEGEVVGDEPYFEGICDCKSPILSNVGKNLFDGVSYIDGFIASGNNYTVSPDTDVTSILVNVNKNTDYTLSAKTSFNRSLVGGSLEPISIGTKTTNLNAERVSNTIKFNSGEYTNVIIYLNSSKIDIEDIQVEEGSVSTTYESYKSNILSCNGDKIELTEDMFEQGTINETHAPKDYNAIKTQSGGAYFNKRIRLKSPLPIKPNTTYIINVSNNYDVFVGFCLDGVFLDNYIGYKGNVVFTTPSNCNEIALVIKNGNDEALLIANFSIDNIRLSEVDKTIVLRSLPNGVCDTLNVETGEYTQRIVEIEFDGSDDEVWRQASGSTNGLYMRYTSSGLTTNKKQKTTRMLCDKLIGADWKYWEVNGNVPPYECVFGHVDLVNIQACVLASKYATVDDWIAYLKQNPVTVQYELETPVVKTVDLSGYPFSYENGHVILSSGSIEQSLTPKVEYSVATNRNGQIRSNQKMVERHQKQLDRLQAMILTNLVNTQYEQTLTNLKYDLKNVREEVK